MCKRGKLKKTVAALLVMALLTQQSCISGLAEEVQTEAQTAEAETSAAETQATEAPAVETQVTETSVETQAAETQTTEASAAETSAAETQAAEAQTTEASAAETSAAETQVTETQSAENGSQSEESETQESETNNKKKKKASETETETETERSERQNAGEQLKLAELVKKLSGALPWLFVGKSVTIPQAASDRLAESLTEETTEDAEESLTEEITESEDTEEFPDTLILQGKEGETLLASLAKVSLALADAQTTKEVTVLNIYADAEGNLDETQLTDLYADKVLDVTDTVYVINVIADAEEQELNFSGYKMKNAGTEVLYEDEGDSGSVIYNFAAIDEDSYVSYKGTLKLSGNLQGTFLAPEASAELNGNLAGAVYAGSVTVKNENASLLRVVFQAEESQEETEDEEEEQTKSGFETETEAGSETEAEEQTDAAVTETETETGASTEMESETDAEAESESETDTETESESETDTEMESESEADTEMETQGESETEPATDVPDEAMAASETGTGTGRSITVSAQAFYGETSLTALTDVTGYAALFSGTGTSLTRVSEVKELVFQADQESSKTVIFDGLDAGTYYVAATDAAGNPLTLTDTEGNLLTVAAVGTEAETAASETETETGTAAVNTGTESETAVSAEPGAASGVLASADSLQVPIVTVTVGEEESAAAAAVLSYRYTDSWPEDSFYCAVKLSVTLNVVDREGAALSGSEKFYISVYSDEGRTVSVTDKPVTFSMGGSSTKTKSCVLKLTSLQQTFYLSETDSEGVAVTTGENGFGYIVTFDSSAEITVAYSDASASVTVQNQLNDSIVKIRVEDASDGSLLAGATLAIKDSQGNIYEVETAGSKTFTSGTADLVWTNALTDGETYYLTEISAPAGYTPVPDLAFTVVRGCTTEVILQNEATVSSNYALTVTKEVYVGDYQVYAYDTTTGAYQAKGAYTYYVALFSDSACTKKVSNVVSLDVSGFTGNVTFTNLVKNSVYYVAETDAYGVVLSSTDAHTIRYTNSGMVKMSEKTRSMVVQNVYASLPEGYRYTGTLTLTLRVTDSSGTAEAVTNTFYIGIYRNADYSDTPTIVKMDLSNASSVSVRRRILLSGESDMTYYIAEVDSAGTRITDSSDFSYVVTVDNPTVTITKGSNSTVTVTNKVKATKATLYLTKRVYEGTDLKAVSETFYVGLFKDADMTELYADPIAMKLENTSELTLKLTLNLGSSSGVTVYVAETDEEGNVITDQSAFGYQIRIANATAAFTQDNLEIQTVILNSVYGTTSDDDWDSIYSSTSSDLLGSSTSYTIDENGTTSAVQTGDDTPLFGYLLLMGASLAVFGWEVRRKRRYQSGG